MFVAGIAAAFSFVAAGATFDLDYTASARATPTLRAMKTRLASAADPLDAGVLRQDVVAAPPLEGQLQVGDDLNVTLFDDRTMKLHLAEQTPSASDVAAFLAKMDGYGDELVATVVQAEGRVHIDIQAYRESRVYSVLSSEEGAVVKEMDPHLLSITPTQRTVPPMKAVRTVPNLAAAPQVLSAVKGSPPRLLEGGTKPTVDILVAYDTDAASWAKSNGGGLSAFAEVQVQKMNMAIANTGLDQDFRFRLVGVYEIGFSAGGDVGMALDVATGTISTLNGHSWSGLRAKRDELEADIVCVLVDNGKDSGITGIGWSLEKDNPTDPLEDTCESFSELAYNASLIRAVQQGHTMTHEVGHNMGAGHSTEMYDPKDRGPQLFNYSSGYYFTAGGNKYHTIMAYGADGYGNFYTSVPYFSSPNHTCNSVTVGNSTHDNTKTLKQTFSYTSRYRGGVVTPELGAGTDAESYTWETSALYPWSKVTSSTYDGVDAVRSEQDAAASWMRTKVVGPAKLTFYFRMYTYYGTFEVTCDGTSLFSKKNEDVNIPWTMVTENIPAGEHVIKFAYTRSSTGYYYPGDGVWVDNVSFQGGSPAAETYTVTYKPGSYGSGSQQMATKTKNVALTLKGVIFTRTGYTQTGWATIEGGSKAYNLNASYTANASITLYPYWEATSTGPANNNFSSPTTISGTSGSTSGSSAGATVETSEPKPSAQSNSGASVWYKWTAPSSGTATFDTIGSNFDTVLAVYTGTALASLTEVKSDDDNGGNRTSKLTFQATSGTTYRIAVYGYSGKTGTVKLNWSLATPYTVTYKPGSYGSGSQQTAAKIKDVALTLKGAIFTRTGYTQTGWATSDGGSKVYNLSASYTGNASITLYPYWTANTYTVTLDRRSGSGGSASVTATYGSDMPAITKPTRTGYTFGGYFTAIDGGGVKYYDAAGASARTWNMTSPTTLYAKWTVNMSPSAPANNNFSSPTTISGASGTVSGSNAGATMEASERKPSAQSNSGASVWYKWTAPSSGTVVFDTIGSGFDTVLAVYTGSALTSLGEVASDDDNGGNRTSKLTFQATSGTTYRIAVYGYNGQTGNVKLTWSLATPTTYTVTYKPGSYGSGSQQMATKTKNVALTLKGAIFTRTGYTQTGWSTSDGGSKAYNLGASYTENAVITLYPFWTATTTAPANDNFASATTITGASGSTSGSNVGATMEASEPKPSAQSDSGASVWYKWTAPSSGTVTLDTIGSSFDTVLAVYTGTALTSLSEVESDDDSGNSGYTSKLTFQATSGTTYRIAVYGHDSETGRISLKWSLAATPSGPANDSFSSPTTISGGLCHVPLAIAAPWTAEKAVTLNGAVYDGVCNVMGIVQLKVGKPKTDRRRGTVTTKVTGYVMLLDGKKKSLKSASASVPRDAPIEVSATVKGMGTLTVTIGDGGFTGALGGYIVRTANVGGNWATPRAAVNVDFAAGSAFPGGTIEALLPVEVPVTVVSGRWRFGKAASIKIKNGAIVGIYDPAKPNLSGLKLSYTPKKGTFKGSFNLYALESAGSLIKLKKYRVSVNGVVVDGVGYGKAICKKPALFWPLMVVAVE